MGCGFIIIYTYKRLYFFEALQLDISNPLTLICKSLLRCSGQERIGIDVLSDSLGFESTHKSTYSHIII